MCENCQVGILQEGNIQNEIFPFEIVLGLFDHFHLHFTFQQILLCEEYSHAKHFKGHCREYASVRKMKILAKPQDKVNEIKDGYTNCNFSYVVY